MRLWMRLWNVDEVDEVVVDEVVDEDVPSLTVYL